MLAAINIVVGCLIQAGNALIIPQSIAFSSARGIFQNNGHPSYFKYDYDTPTTTTALDMRTRRRRRKRPRRGGVKFDIVNEDDGCQVLDRRLDHQGLAKSIDAEYALEEEKLGMSRFLLCSCCFGCIIFFFFCSNMIMYLSI